MAESQLLQFVERTIRGLMACRRRQVRGRNEGERLWVVVRKVQMKVLMKKGVWSGTEPGTGTTNIRQSALAVAVSALR